MTTMFWTLTAFLFISIVCCVYRWWRKQIEEEPEEEIYPDHYDYPYGAWRPKQEKDQQPN
jgi:hypothetical protein